MAPDRLTDARAVHICNTASRSGIADYARDFHQIALEPEGYVLAGADDILDGNLQFAPDTRFHVQLGVFQHRERLAISRLMRQGYRNIEATIHDPPFLTFPYFQFRSKLMMRLSRGFDWYLGAFGLQRRALERLSRVFVLSQRGRDSVLRLAPGANPVVIPHIVRSDRIWAADTPLGDNLLYFGFIGPGKGLDYVLALHEAVVRLRPGTQLHVIGQAAGAEAQRYVAELQRQYQRDVIFHGYVPEQELDALFEDAGHVVLPYAAQKYIVPASGSVIHAMRRARIVWTTDVNTMQEIVQDGKNGFFLAMDLDRDAIRMAKVLADPAQARKISDAARESALTMAHYPYRAHFTPD